MARIEWKGKRSDYYDLLKQISDNTSVLPEIRDLLVEIRDNTACACEQLKEMNKPKPTDVFTWVGGSTIYTHQDNTGGGTLDAQFISLIAGAFGAVEIFDPLNVPSWIFPSIDGDKFTCNWHTMGTNSGVVKLLQVDTGKLIEFHLNVNVEEPVQYFLGDSAAYTDSGTNQVVHEFYSYTGNPGDLQNFVDVEMFASFAWVDSYKIEQIPVSNGKNCRLTLNLKPNDTGSQRVGRFTVYQPISSQMMYIDVTQPSAPVDGTVTMRFMTPQQPNSNAWMKVTLRNKVTNLTYEYNEYLTSTLQVWSGEVIPLGDYEVKIESAYTYLKAFNVISGDAMLSNVVVKDYEITADMMMRTGFLAEVFYES